MHSDNNTKVYLNLFINLNRDKNCFILHFHNGMHLLMIRKKNNQRFKTQPFILR